MRVPLSAAPEQRIERVLDLNLRLVLWKLRWRINGVDEGEEEEEKEDEKKRDCEEASGGAASIEDQCSRTVAHSSSRVCVTGWEKNVSVEGETFNENRSDRLFVGSEKGPWAWPRTQVHFKPGAGDSSLDWAKT